MIIAYAVSTMTDLRYLVPLSRGINRYLPSQTHIFDLQRHGKKYNGLSNGANYAIAVDVIAKHCQYASMEPVSDADVVIQIETGSSMSCKRRIALQHGFDTAFLKDELKNIDVYVCTSMHTAEFAISHGMKNVVYPSIPIAFWDLGNVIQPENNLATVFYPDAGDNDIAAYVVDALLARGYDVIVKQRRKHQAIQCAGRHVYDDVWYPSEAIAFPAVSHFTVGFGSSAYTDIVAAGLNYVNIDVNSSRYPWNVFTHPVSTNYIRIQDRALIDDCLDLACKLEHRRVSLVDESSFIGALL